MRQRPTLLVLTAAAALGLSALWAGASAEIRVGLAVPLTGRMAPVGLSMQRALEQAIDGINAEGGVLGQPLVLAVEDDGCATATAEGAAQALLRQSPALVIGHPCSNAAVAAAPVYGRSGILLIAVGPRHPDVTRRVEAVTAPAVRLAGRDDKQGAIAASWLLDHSPGRRMAVVHDRTEYSRGIVDATLKELRVSQVAPVALLPIVAGKRSYDEIAAKLGDSRAEAILFVGFPEEAQVLASAMELRGLALPMLVPDAAATPELAEFAGKTKMRVQALMPRELKPRVDGVNDDVTAAGVRARGALEAWLATARKTGSIEGPALAGALRGARVATPSLGEIKFDQNGDLDDRYAFVPATARDGRWVKDNR
jgi:branched-chain amino acid transport system substrate-binding protein